MKSSHPNPQRNGYNLEGSLTRIANHKITMIKYRQEIIAHTFRNYTRQRIRQLLSYPFNDNMSSYQGKHIALPTSFGGRILNLGNNKSYLRWNIWLYWIRFRFSLVVKLWQLAQIPFPSSPPPLDFGVEANGFMYCPTTCTLTWTSKGQTGSIHFWIVH